MHGGPHYHFHVYNVTLDRLNLLSVPDVLLHVLPKAFASDRFIWLDRRESHLLVGALDEFSEFGAE